jgi:hypothetical protein
LTEVPNHSSNFKDHFIAGLCSCDPRLPVKVWDILLPQVTIMLNLLHKSWINPRMSAYAQLNGKYDFNRSPMEPPGRWIIAHEKPDIVVIGPRMA